MSKKDIKKDIMKCGCETVANVMTILYMCEKHEWMLCDDWELERREGGGRVEQPWVKNE